ncbi:MAG: radical SAM family heme chaperone HemW [Thermomicrobiales bacterium]
MAPLPPAAPIGLYAHIPFCSHICPYCDFTTYRGQEPLIPRYVDALVLDIERQGRSLDGRPAATLFLGGGTPSLLSPEQIGRVVQAARAGCSLAEDAEATLEANPNSVDREYFAGLLAAGVNRLSLGVQTLDRKGLRTLGRQHEAADAEAAYRAARAAGFADISLDLIFDWPGQSAESWARDLDLVLAWPDGGPDHLSLYSLIVEPGTPMADAVARGILVPLDDDAAADRYEAAMARMAAAGFVHYEVANWARSSEFASKHNTLYWRNGDYLAFGAGAHGHVAGRRTINHLAPGRYIAAIGNGLPPAANTEEISASGQIGETMMVGLRLLLEGIGGREFAARHGVTLEAAFGPTIAELERLGLLRRDRDALLLTPRGLMVANDVCARFL